MVHPSYKQANIVKWFEGKCIYLNKKNQKETTENWIKSKLNDLVQSIQFNQISPSSTWILWNVKYSTVQADKWVCTQLEWKRAKRGERMPIQWDQNEKLANVYRFTGFKSLARFFSFWWFLNGMHVLICVCLYHEYD